VQVLHRDGWKCRSCRSRNSLTAHHIVYRSHGGDDADWNLITVCGYCHDSIHKPNPNTGSMLVILPQVEGEPIDANKPVKFFAANGWKPRGKVA
jgi:5-methylcytosine-specific restriction endonuclease McrA